MPEPESLDTWFKREIVVHEGALDRYLLRAWPNPHDVFDLRQDVYVRVYEAAAKARPHAPKSFLFVTARHLLTDRLRRKRVVAIDAVGDPDSLNVLVEDLSPEHRVSAHQELRRLAEALDNLPPRCRDAVWLRRVDEIPQKEVARLLGLTPKMVEKHLRKGILRLTAALFGSDDARPCSLHGPRSLHGPARKPATEGDDREERGG